METISVILLIIIIYILLIQSRKVPGAEILTLGKRKIILDSCALIDGRIVDLVRTGFVADQLIVPKFILSELQMLADGNDAHKRERARFGLEIAAELQEYTWANVQISEVNFSGISATDDKLVQLAKKMRGALCTTDYNLNKVASIEGVRVLNINELAQGLRPVTLPGEELQVKIVQKGSNAEQGVGYLEDGTMIVVDGAAKSTGSTIPVIVDRMHQTVAGKMVFAHTRTQKVAPRQQGPQAAPSRAQSSQQQNSVLSRLRPRNGQSRNGAGRSGSSSSSTTARRMRGI